MRINRSIWPEKFEKNSFPKLPCPKCDHGHLKVILQSVQKEEATYSDRAKGHDGWEPDWITERFVAAFRCDNSECGDSAFMVGEVKYEEIDVEGLNGEWEKDVSENFIPKVIYPAPPLFPLPGKTPQNVYDSVYQSFSHFWNDRWASANKVRTSIEYLLDHLKIPKSEKKAGKGRRYRSLDERIRLFRQENADVADALLAIKWVGNVASHSHKDIEREKMFTVYDIYSDVLTKLFDRHQQQVQSAVKRLNKTKGKGKWPIHST